jgi:glucose-6-phosphate 1-dehydrogenase
MRRNGTRRVLPSGGARAFLATVGLEWQVLPGRHEVPAIPLKQPADQDIVVVGASGDLASKRLLPALYNLERERLLPNKGRIVGMALADWTDQDFRVHALKSIAFHSRTGLDDAVWERFSPRLAFVPGAGNGDAMKELKARLTQDRRLVYLSVPPSAIQPVVHEFGDAGLADGTSLVVEKPFGRDTGSARALNAAIHEVLPEDRIFRIDHYLGKESVQNLLVFRFANPLFERQWNRDGVHRIEITVAESAGVGSRGRYYEETGAVRDIVQNHVFQLLALTAMEAPTSMTPEAIRVEKAKLLASARPVDPQEVVRGQYTSGMIDAEHVPGYTQEDGVSPDSTAETYAAMRMYVDNWRWGGTKFLLRTGKRLARRETRVVVVFRDAPRNFFETTEIKRLVSQKLHIRIQPDEGIALTFVLKQPGPVVATQAVNMNFSYGDSFKSSPPEAYERLLHDAMLGDHTLFISEAEVERGWELVQPVLDNPPPVVRYAAGSRGPEDADELVAPRRWHALEDDAL